MSPPTRGRDPEEWFPPSLTPWMEPWSKVTHSPEYREGGLRRFIVASYGMEQIGERPPYFSMTGDVLELHRTRWARVLSGAIGDEIEKHFRKLAPFAKWHLTDARGPMHYLANAGYWWDIVSGRREAARSDPDPLSAFATTIVFGALENDEMPPPGTPTEEVVAWLRDRLPRLQRAFSEDMRAAYELEV